MSKEEKIILLKNKADVKSQRKTIQKKFPYGKSTPCP